MKTEAPLKLIQLDKDTAVSPSSIIEVAMSGAHLKVRTPDVQYSKYYYQEKDLHIAYKNIIIQMAGYFLDLD